MNKVLREYTARLGLISSLTDGLECLQSSHTSEQDRANLESMKKEIEEYLAETPLTDYNSKWGQP